MAKKKSEEMETEQTPSTDTPNEEKTKTKKKSKKTVRMFTAEFRCNFRPNGLNTPCGMPLKVSVDKTSLCTCDGCNEEYIVVPTQYPVDGTKKFGLKIIPKFPKIEKNGAKGSRVAPFTIPAVINNVEQT